MVRNLYKPPDNLRDSLKILTEPFGGVEEALRLLPTSKVDYLLVFPGFIYVTSEWKPLVDLRQHDYLAGSVYTVYDAEMRHLYSERSPDGYFGRREHDKELLRSVRHGMFVHLQLMTVAGPRLGILWIARRKSPRQLEQELQRLRYNAEKVQTLPQQHELMFDTRCLEPLPLDSYFLQGRWEQQLSPSRIREHPDATRLTHPASTPFFLYPQQDGWLTFFQGDRLAVLQDSRGEGVRRLRTGPACSLFVQTTNINVAAPHPVANDVAGRLTGSTWAASDSFLHVQATLSTVDVLDLSAQADIAVEDGLWLGVADGDTEPEFAWGYERQFLLFGSLRHASVVFKAVRYPWTFDTVLVGRGSEILRRIRLSQVYRLEDSRVAVMTFTALG